MALATTMRSMECGASSRWRISRSIASGVGVAASIRPASSAQGATSSPPFPSRAGGGPDEARLRALAAELGVEREITFTGALPREGIAQRCQRAHLFVLTPYEEAFGNVFAEALAAGLPIVASSVGAIPSLVKNGDNGILVAPGDSIAIARAIRELGEDPERRALMSARNRARAEAALSWDTAAGSYLALYAELIEERREAAV